MQLDVTIDLTGVKPDVILGLLYACDDNGTRFTYTGTDEKIVATLDGAKTLTQAEYDAITGLPYTLTFAKPPVES